MFKASSSTSLIFLCNSNYYEGIRGEKKPLALSFYTNKVIVSSLCNQGKYSIKPMKRIKMHLFHSCLVLNLFGINSISRLFEGNAFPSVTVEQAMSVESVTGSPLTMFYL